MRNIFFILILATAAILPDRTQGQVILKTDTVSIDCASSDTFLVALRTRNFNNIGSMQFTLSWNPAYLDYVYTGEIHPLFLAGSTNIGFDTTSFLSQGRLTFTWTRFGGGSVPDDTLLFPVAFTRITGPFAPVEFVGMPVSIEVTDPIGNELPFMLMNGGVLPLDNEAPSLECPADTVVSAPAPIPVFNIGLVATTDNCDLANTGFVISGATNLNAPNDDDASGSVFNFGQSTVTYTGTDVGGNTATCSFLVTLENTGGGDLTLVAQNGTATCGETFAIHITALNFDSIGSLQFSLGWAPDVLSFDSVGNFNPALLLGAGNFGTAFTGTGFLSFAWTTNGLAGTTLPTGDTLFTVYVTVTGNGSMGSLLEFGNFPSVVEAFSNSMLPSFEIPVVLVNGNLDVIDNEAPVIDCPANVNVSVSMGMTTADVMGLAPTLADNCSDTVAYSYVLSGATLGSGQGDADGTYNAGVTTVTYTAADAAGNTATCAFTVTVDAGEVLTLYLDSVSVECKGVGQMVSVNISVENFINVFGLQFSVEWDETVLQFESVTNDYPGLNLTPSDFLGYISTPSGILRFLAGNAISGWPVIPDGGTLFTINFTVLQANAPTFINFLAPFDAVNGTFQSIPLITFNGAFESTDVDPPVFVQCPSDTLVNANPGDCFAIFTLPEPVAVDSCTGLMSLVSDQTDDNFEAGETLVTFTATDSVGNTAACSYTVTVIGNLPPGFMGCPDTILAYTTNASCSAVVDWVPPVPEGGCGGAGSLQVNSDAMPMDTFGLGETQVTYTVTDQLGNTGQCTFVIIVSDTISPLLNCPLSDIVPVDSGSCEATITFGLPVVSDACDQQPTLSSDVAPGTVLPIGTHVITYTATDDSGNSATCSFVLTVRDFNPPVLTCPEDLTVEAAPDTCGAFPTWALPGVTDDCSVGNLTPTSGFDPGDFIPVGTTTVTYFAADDFNNVGTCNFSVTVTESTAPEFVACSPNLIVSLPPNQCDSTITFSAPQVDDNCDPAPTLAAEPASGSLFSAGTTVVTFTAEDASGNTSTCTFTVTLIDQIAPQFLSCPPDTVIMDAGACGLVLDWAFPEATDNCGLDTIFASHQPEDTLFAGTTEIVLLAVDFGNNYDTCSFSVTINANQMLGFDGQLEDLIFEGCFAVVDWAPPTPVGFCVTPDVTVNFMPGDTFPLGITVVEYIATDVSSGLTISTSFSITVVDPEPPVFLCPQAVVVNAGGLVLSDPDGFLSSVDTLGDCSGARLVFSQPGVSDNCGVDMAGQTGGLASGSPFPVGSYLLDFEATDVAGNRTSCNVSVTVLPLRLSEGQVDPNPGCEGDFVTLTVDSLTGANYTWTGPLMSYPNASQITIVSLSAGNAGIYTVFAEVNGCATPVDTVEVLLVTAPQANDDLNFEVIAGQILDTLNVLSNDSIFSVNDVLVSVLTDSVPGLVYLGNGVFSFDASQAEGNRRITFVYEICSAICEDLCDMASVTITIKDSDCTFIPNVFSPNGDGVNDSFEVPCIDSGFYEDNSLVVYNQWGDKVFEAAPYSNAPSMAWNGAFMNENGKELPDGVYFYIFDPGNNAKPLKGFVHIFR